MEDMTQRTAAWDPHSPAPCYLALVPTLLRPGREDDRRFAEENCPLHTPDVSHLGPSRGTDGFAVLRWWSRMNLNPEFLGEGTQHRLRLIESFLCGVLNLPDVDGSARTMSGLVESGLAFEDARAVLLAMPLLTEMSGGAPYA